MTARRSQAGFTLIELMISLVLFSFAVAGVLAVAVSMSQGFREQRAAIGAEGAVRVPLDFITDALRQASPGAPTGNIQDAGTCTGATLKVTNNQTSLSSAPTVAGWDKLEVIFASGAVVTSTLDDYDASLTTLRVNDTSQFVKGDSIVISNTAQGHLFKITDIAGNTLTLAPKCGGFIPPTGGKYSAGSLVVRAMHVVFTIDSIDGVPTLMMDPDQDGPAVPEPLAEGVEDLQIVLGVDTDGNGVITKLPPAVAPPVYGPPWEDSTAANIDEWQGNNAGDAVLAGPVRAVRVTLIARTTSGTVGNAATFVRPAAEDHAAGGPPDKFRRRVLKSTVEIRNMQGSP